MLVVEAVQIKNENEIADYRVLVLANEQVIWRGIVTDHDRSKGWITLLLRIAQKALREEPHAR